MWHSVSVKRWHQESVVTNCEIQPKTKYIQFMKKDQIPNNLNENHDIAIAMSSSLADPELGLNILQG